MGDVDLERLAGAYALRPASRASTERAAAAGSRLETGSWILDVGGGPGRHSAIWRNQGHRPIVVDPSWGMLTTAVQRGVFGVRGIAQAQPFTSRRFALVWFHLSIHYGDWRASIGEAARLVADRGRVEIWTLGPNHHRQSMLSKWFPSIAGLDARRFPDPDRVAELLAARFPSVSVTNPVETVVRAAGTWIPAVEAGFVSTLHLLSDEERTTGIRAIKARYPDPSEEIAYELRFTRIVADQTVQ